MENLFLLQTSFQTARFNGGSVSQDQQVGTIQSFSSITRKTSHTNNTSIFSRWHKNRSRLSVHLSVIQHSHTWTAGRTDSRFGTYVMSTYVLIFQAKILTKRARHERGVNAQVFSFHKTLKCRGPFGLPTQWPPTPLGVLQLCYLRCYEWGILELSPIMYEPGF